MSTTTVLRTAEDLLGLSVPGKRFEMLDGEVIEMAPAGARHGMVAMKIGARLSIHAEQNELGEVFAAETGFILTRNPDTVRAPDVAFVANNRLPPEGLPAGFMEAPPDLAVEVVSPGGLYALQGRAVAAVRRTPRMGRLSGNAVGHGLPVAERCTCPYRERHADWSPRRHGILLSGQGLVLGGCVGRERLDRAHLTLGHWP